MKIRTTPEQTVEHWRGGELLGRCRNLSDLSRFREPGNAAFAEDGDTLKLSGGVYYLPAENNVLAGVQERSKAVNFFGVPGKTIVRMKAAGTSRQLFRIRGEAIPMRQRLHGIIWDLNAAELYATTFNNEGHVFFGDLHEATVTDCEFINMGVGTSTHREGFHVRNNLRSRVRRCRMHSFVPQPAADGKKLYATVWQQSAVGSEFTDCSIDFPLDPRFYDIDVSTVFGFGITWKWAPETTPSVYRRCRVSNALHGWHFDTTNYGPTYQYLYDCETWNCFRGVDVQVKSEFTDWTIDNCRFYTQPGVKSAGSRGVNFAPAPGASARNLRVSNNYFGVARRPADSDPDPDSIGIHYAHYIDQADWTAEGNSFDPNIGTQTSLNL